MNCKKIRNIEKHVCTCEQKIAYNFAFMYYDMGKKLFESCHTGIVKSDCFESIINLVLSSLQRKEFERYNKDSIIVAFRQGFETYCKNFFIGSNYEQIGKCFTIPYEIV